jgi:hypothetical protein
MIAPELRVTVRGATGMLQSRGPVSADQVSAGGACYRDAWPGAGSERVRLYDAGTISMART